MNIEQLFSLAAQEAAADGRLEDYADNQRILSHVNDLLPLEEALPYEIDGSEEPFTHVLRNSDGTFTLVSPTVTATITVESEPLIDWEEACVEREAGVNPNSQLANW